MKKNVVGYCKNCMGYTEHKVIECEDSVPNRILEAVISLGFSTLYERNYYCKCEKCDNINKLNF